MTNFSEYNFCTLYPRRARQASGARNLLQCWECKGSNLFQGGRIQPVKQHLIFYHWRWSLALQHKGFFPLLISFASYDVFYRLHQVRLSSGVNWRDCVETVKAKVQQKMQRSLTKQPYLVVTWGQEHTVIWTVFSVRYSLQTDKLVLGIHTHWIIIPTAAWSLVLAGTPKDQPLIALGQTYSTAHRLLNPPCVHWWLVVYVRRWSTEKGVEVYNPFHGECCILIVYCIYQCP